MSISSVPRRSAFCAILAFRWSSYSLSRIGDRSGEEEGSRRVCFFGLRAFDLPLPDAGAIVGDRLLEWGFKEGDRFNNVLLMGFLFLLMGICGKYFLLMGFLFLLMESPYPVALSPAPHFYF